MHCRLKPPPLQHVFQMGHLFFRHPNCPLMCAAPSLKTTKSVDEVLSPLGHWAAGEYQAFPPQPSYQCFLFRTTRSEMAPHPLCFWLESSCGMQRSSLRMEWHPRSSSRLIAKLAIWCAQAGVQSDLTFWFVFVVVAKPLNVFFVSRGFLKCWWGQHTLLDWRPSMVD